MNELDLFAAAIAIADPTERAALLDRECAGRADLRQRLDLLLGAHARSHPLLDEGSPDGTAAYAPPPSLVGTVIAGRYKLLEEIGEGGMGAVWVAEQTEPVKRKVALKLIKAGMDSKSVLARFEAERQALALMDHPNIAKVFDGGLTDAGRPFFAMEYVKGIPITEYCDATKLSVSERLNLFVQVCSAVQHAHQKGIIHRDLKPSNILVAPYDDKPVPKVIDFGLAKAMHQSLTGRTLHTAHETVLGTPLYMSPEQAQLNNLGVDTRSDIYSLGVLLYELLTGTTPLEKKRFKEAAWDEIRRIIREEEPPRPSTRLSSTNMLASLAACRQTEPLKLTKQVRGELDWIVMKSLEKDRSRRYETANGFAMDIQRYLAGEPVLAVPASASYRLRKFARRHRGALAGAAVLTVALLLALGTAAASIGYVVRDRTARQAELERERATRQAKTEAEVEAALREAEFFRQQTRWPEALAAAQKADAVLKSGEGDSAVEERVRQAVADLNMVVELENIQLRKSPSHSNPTEMKQAEDDYVAAFRRYGIDVDALPAETAAERIRARPIRGELVAALNDWIVRRNNSLNNGNFDRGGLKDPGTRHLLTVLRAANPDPWSNGGWNAMSQPMPERKTLLLQLTAEMPVGEIPPVTVILLAFGLRSVGAPEQAAALLAKAQRLHPDNFWLNHDLAHCLALVGGSRLEEALRYYTAAQALRPRSPEVLVNFGSALQKKGAVDDAIALCRNAISLQPNHPAAYRYLGTAYRSLGSALGAKGLWDEAEATYREALRLWPNDGNFHFDLANCLRQKQALDQAIAEYREGLRHRPDAGWAHGNLGSLLRQKGLLDEAIAAYREGVRLQPDTGWLRYSLAHMLRQKGLLDEAIVEFREVLRRQPEDVPARHNLAYSLWQKGLVDEAIAEYREVIHRQPDHLPTRVNLGSVLLQKGALDEAITEYRELIRRQPTDAAHHTNLGFALLEMKQFAEAEPHLRESLAFREKAQPDTWSTFNTRSMLGGALLGQKKYADAEPLLLKGYEGMKAREKMIPITGGGELRIPEALDRLIELYTTTNKADEVKKWQAERAKYPSSEKK
jgi:serine/threonine protein kinase/tetratricopeptide (TPR) repeat protein